MKQSERITNAIIETLFGKQPWISGVHPLRKSKCGLCGAYVTQKDSESHAAGHETEALLPMTDAEIDDMFSMSEQYRAAH